MRVEAYSVVTEVHDRPERPEQSEDATQNRQQMQTYQTALRTWEKLESKAQRVIVAGMTEETMQHITTCETAKEMWDTLVGVYESKSETSIHMLQQDWFRMEKKSTDNIAVHIAKVEDLAHRMKGLVETVSDTMIMTKILLTLSSFNHFVTAWESTAAAERTLINLKPRLMMEEKRSGFQEDSAGGSALASRASKQKDQIRSTVQSRTKLQTWR